jgi:hydroxyacylglutathione hydrolase
MPAPDVAAAQHAGVVVVDTRSASAFARAHIPRSVHIGLAGQFAAWAGDLLGLRANLILVAEDAGAVTEAHVRLARVGIENIAGYLEHGIGGWVLAGLPVAQTPDIPVTALHELLSARPSEVQVVDVRRAQECAEAAIPGSLHIPLHDLEARATELRPGQTVAVYCKSGYRSMIGASLLERAGLTAISNLTGGMDAWQTCGLPVMREEL